MSETMRFSVEGVELTTPVGSRVAVFPEVEGGDSVAVAMVNTTGAKKVFVLSGHGADALLALLQFARGRGPKPVGAEPVVYETESGWRLVRAGDKDED